VPSAREIGVPGYNIQPWFGVYVSSKTPPAVVAQVRELVMQAISTPATKATLERRGQDPIAVCGDAMAKFQADEIELWRGVLKRAGIEPQ
jgi:tripartite-type tricarboxylate transporter receptor subunit TctC